MFTTRRKWNFGQLFLLTNIRSFQFLGSSFLYHLTQYAWKVLGAFLNCASIYWLNSRYFLSLTLKISFLSLWEMPSLITWIKTSLPIIYWFMVQIFYCALWWFIYYRPMWDLKFFFKMSKGLQFIALAVPSDLIYQLDLKG